MRNKAVLRGLAWILSAATVMTSIPVSAAELVPDNGVATEASVSEASAVVEDASDAAVAEESKADTTDEEKDASAKETEGSDATEDAASEDAPAKEAEEKDATKDTAAKSEDKAQADTAAASDSQQASDARDESADAAKKETSTKITYSYVYTGQEISAQLAEGESVKGGTASAVKVGTYTVELADEDGETREQTWEITPAELTATCYYTEVKTDEAENAKDGETSSDIQVDVEVTGFVNGENEKTAAGYVAPQYTQPSTLEAAAKMKAFGGEADNYTFAYADSVKADAGEIATLSDDDDMWKSYMWSSKAGTEIAVLQVVSFDEDIAVRLTDDCTLTVEDVTEGDAYEAMKTLLNKNKNHENSVDKFGYIKLNLKDKGGKTINLENADTRMKLTYIGKMGTVSNVPSYVYSVFDSELMASGFDEDEEPSYAEGMGMSFLLP